MKNYIKPAISFQSLSMSTAVSDGCNTEPTNAEYQCPVQIWGDETVFTANSDCFFEPDDSITGSICYHGPEGLVSVFGS